MKYKIITILLLQFIFLINMYANNTAEINHKSNNNGYSSPRIIENQSWVTSKSLNKNELEQILKKYPNFKIIQFDSLYGVLVEYNNFDKNVLEKLEKLKKEPGIYRVFNKVEEQKNSFQLYIPE